MQIIKTHAGHAASVLTTRQFIVRILKRVGIGLGLLLFLSTAAYYSVSAYRLNTGHSRETALPGQDIRIGIINGTTDPTLLAAAHQQLLAIRSEQFTLAVASTESFQLHRVAQTFLVCRDGQREAAVLFAQHLGIPTDRIVMQQLPQNAERISISLVLGDDFRSLRAQTRGF